MAAYIPYALLGVHTVVATARTPRLQMPKRDFLARTARQQGESIVRSVLSVDNALSRSGVSARTFVLDYVSPLLDLISPNVRPVNQRMMSAREKADFAAAVSVMSSLKVGPCSALRSSSRFALTSLVDELLQAIVRDRGRHGETVRSCARVVWHGRPSDCAHCVRRADPPVSTRPSTSWSSSTA
jgi:hypothetical protein